MSDKTHLLQYLEAMLNPDNNIRNQSETLLLNTAAQNTDVFVSLILEIIGDANCSTSIRNSGCIVLKKVLTVFDSDTIKGFKLLSDPAKEHFQRTILLLLSRESTNSIRDQISDLISDVASSVILDDSIPPNQKWTSLAQHLFELFSTNNEQSILAVFRIFDGLFSNVSNHFTGLSANFLKLFEAGFNHQSSTVNISCLECLSSLIQTVKAKDLRIYKQLGENILRTCLKILNTKDEEDLQACLGYIYDICEIEPSFLKPRFDDMMVVMTQVRASTNDPNSALKTESVECLLFQIERYPKLAKENLGRLTKLVELIFLNMMEIEDMVPEDWCSPADGFNDDFEDDDDQKIIKVGMDFIDRLMICLGNDIMLKMMNDCVASLFAQSNWKMHHAAIMAMSQIGEYLIDKVGTEVVSILNLVSQFSTHQNPRIRYACCHLLGQFADDLSPTFQEKFHEIYFKTVLPLLNDPVPRVVAHALASLTNFLENANSAQIEPHFIFIYQRIMYSLENSISFVKEACLSALSALCEGAGELFYSVYDQAMTTIFAVFAQSKSKVYKQLRGNAIECATIIGKICGIERFQQYYPHLIQEMINIQTNDIEGDQFDPQRAYLLAGWQRMVIALEAQFKPFIPLVLPKLLELAKSGHASSGGDNFKTSDSEETEIAVQTIAVFLDNLGVDLLPYVNDIFNVLHLIIENTQNDEIRMEAIKCLPGLIKIYKKAGQDLTVFGRHVNQTLWALMDKDHDPQNLSELAFTIQKAIKNMGPILSDLEINTIYLQCFEQMKKSAERKNTLGENFDNEEENEADINDLIDNDNQMEVELTLELANIIGIIFKVYKQRSLFLFEHAYKNLISPALSDPSLKTKHLALFLIDDSVEHLGPFLPKEILVSFLQTASAFALNSSLDLRQAALFGIGIIAVALEQQFHPTLQSTLQLLAQAIEIPKMEDDLPKFHLTVKENAVASFGKILKKYGNVIPRDQLKAYLIYWLKHMPILHDHKESIMQHQFMLALITDQNDPLEIRNPEILKRVLEIFVRIHPKKKLCDAEMQVSIQSVVNGFKNNPEISAILSTMTFTDDERDFLNKC